MTGTMNEPLPGFIGVSALDKLSGPLKNDVMPTPFEGMALGSGHAVLALCHVCVRGVPKQCVYDPYHICIAYSSPVFNSVLWEVFQ